MDINKASYNDAQKHIHKDIRDCSERDLLIRHDERLNNLTVMLREVLKKQGKKIDGIESKLWAVVFVLIASVLSLRFF